MDIPLKEDRQYKQKHVIYIWYTWLKKRWTMGPNGFMGTTLLALQI